MIYRLWHDSSKKEEHLDLAFQYLQEAIVSLDYFFRNLNTASKYQLAEYAASVYNEAIIINHMLQQTTGHTNLAREAFSFSEHSKSYLLYESMQEADALSFAGLPDSLLRREYDLRLDISFYEKQRQAKLDGGTEPTDSTVLIISSKLFDLRRQQENLQGVLERDYPDYYRLKYDLSTISVEEVQRELLQPDQALLEYFVGDSSIFLFLVSPDHFEMLEIAKDFPLEEWVREFRDGISGFHTSKNPSPELRQQLQEQYVETAAKLYEKLIAPLKERLPERLIIVPDGVLGYLPFEALLVERPKRAYRFNSHHYLVRDHAISYSYSATLLREMQRRQRNQQTEKSLLAMAPYYTGDTTLLADLFSYVENMRKDLAPLPYSGEEAWKIGQLWEGDVFVGEDATEERFMQLAGNYRILHLATHGQANDQMGDYSFLAFSEIKDSIENELLYVRDLYNLRLNADLVVLSACETGIGELQRGEGIISLARAFAYAGARSIVTTLWSVADAKTKDFTLEFYRQLKAGLAKDRALQQARLHYLKTHLGPEEAHPFFWAGFVGVGVVDPL